MECGYCGIVCVCVRPRNWRKRYNLFCPSFTPCAFHLFTLGRLPQLMLAFDVRSIPSLRLPSSVPILDIHTVIRVVLYRLHHLDHKCYLDKMSSNQTSSTAAPGKRMSSLSRKSNACSWCQLSVGERKIDSPIDLLSA